MSNSALDVVNDPHSTLDHYTLATKFLSEALVAKAKGEGAFPLVGIHAVAAAADYQLILEPCVELLRNQKHKVAVSCLWPSSDVVIEGVVDSASIPMALSERNAGEMPQLLVVAQSIATITELEAIFAHIMFDIGPNNYREIVVLSLVSHVDAERQLKGLMPEKYREKLLLLDHRKDRDLTPTGLLVPGIGMAPLARAGYGSAAESRSFVPAVFRNKYDFTPRPKPGPENKSTSLRRFR